MIKSLINGLVLALVSSAFIVDLTAQDRDTVRSAAGNRYVISAKAGGVNFVQGEVRVERAGNKIEYLVKGDNLNVGDKVVTGERSRSEILLNPGSYARLDGGTEFEFVTTNLDDLTLKLSRGSAIFEVYAGREFIVTVITPSTRFYLIESGVYRVDVSSDGTSRIEVRKGKAQVGTRNAQTLKKARAASVNGSDVAVSKFSRRDRDEFELWSRTRAKELARANAKLRRNNLRNSLWRGYQSRRWDTFNTFGLWTYSPRFGGYCFLPFGWGWRTPYGFGLNRDIYHFRLPRVIYYVPRVKRQTTYSNPVRRNTDGTTAKTAPRRISPSGTKSSSRRLSGNGAGRIGPKAPSTRARPITRIRTPRRPPTRVSRTPVRRSVIRSAPVSRVKAKPRDN